MSGNQHRGRDELVIGDGGSFEDGPDLAFQGGSVLSGTDPQGAMGTL
jgi:hypothetical protein